MSGCDAIGYLWVVHLEEKRLLTCRCVSFPRDLQFIYLSQSKKGVLIKMTDDEGTAGLWESAKAYDVEERMRTIYASLAFLESA